jgi:hypothetical protein
MSMAAIAVTGVAVAGAGAIAGGIMSSQAAGKQAGSAKKAQKNFEKRVKEANIETPKQLMENIEQYYPGATSQRQQAANIIQQRMSGQPLTQEQIDFVQRQTAEAFGGGYRPMLGKTPGISVAQSQFARNLGMLSTDVATQGVNMAFDWQNLAQSFMQRSAEINLGAAGGQYQAAANTAAARYAADLAPAQAIMGVTQAIGGGMMSVGTAGMMAGGGGGGGGAITGAGGQQYVPATSATGGQFYRPLSGSIYGR